MFVGLNTTAHQTQSLAITTQAIQSVSILQYSQQQLHEFLAEQAERNPLLQVSTSTPADSGRTRAYSAPRGSQWGGRAAPDIADMRASPPSLREHLLKQIVFSAVDISDRRIAEAIVESIDTDGYFRVRVDEFAAILGVRANDVLRVLRIVQTFEPTGIGARDLGECLSLQLAEHDLLTPPMQTMLGNLPLLANCKLDKLATLCGVSVDTVKKMAEQIRQLCPAPGHQYHCDEALPVFPDILVRRSADGRRFEVEMNPELLPNVLIDRDYYAEVGRSMVDRKERRYIVDCYQSAKWLTRVLHQRSQTMLRVATEIVARQTEFLEHGPSHLRPLDLKTIADALGMHTSTVCRAAANKHIMTERGVFEMNYFFSTGLRSSSREGEVSSRSVQQRIKSIVSAEESPLSDDAIVQILSSEGVEIARRTVAKYRGLLKIPPSSLRGRQKSLGLAL